MPGKPAARKAICHPMFCQVRALDRKSEIYPPRPYGEKGAIPSVKSRHCPLRSTRWYFSLGSRGELTDHDQFSGHRRCRGSRFLREHSMIRRWRGRDGRRLSPTKRRGALPLAVPGAGNPGAGWPPRVRTGPIGRRGGALGWTLPARWCVFFFFSF